MGLSMGLSMGLRYGAALWGCAVGLRCAVALSYGAFFAMGLRYGARLRGGAVGLRGHAVGLCPIDPMWVMLCLAVPHRSWLCPIDPMGVMLCPIDPVPHRSHGGRAVPHRSCAP